MIPADVLIPSNAGRGAIKKSYQRRTLYQYIAMSSIGLLGFYNLAHPALRAISLGLLFPGAGFVAMGTISSFAAAVISLGLFLVALYAWYILGGTFIPIFCWLFTALGAGLFPKGDRLWDEAGLVCPICCIGGLFWIMDYSHRLNKAGSVRAEERNKYLIGAVKQQLATATTPPAAGERELDIESLRHIQYMVERGLSPENDWTAFDVIDQFQLCALRYQLYGAISALSVYQCHYVPGFHGYLSRATRNCIEKSLQKKVLSYDP
jgi:hypothetical protein